MLFKAIEPLIPAGLFSEFPWRDMLLLQLFLTVSFVIVIAALAAPLLYNVIRSINPDSSRTTSLVILYLFGSPMFFYSCRIIEYAVMNTFNLLLIFLLLRGKRNARASAGAQGRRARRSPE